jgi:hypothetical protein
MGQSGDRGAGNLRLCGAALLLFLSGLASGGDPIESPGDEAIAVSTPSLPEQIDVPAPPPSPAPPWSGDFWKRSQLTGDWLGSQTKLAENGFSFFGDLTQYYQGVTTGGRAQHFAYGGRGDYLIDIDTGKVGLWEGGHLDLRGETRLGQDCNEIDGAVALSNFAMALPRLNQNLTALTGVQYTQALSESLSVFFGKLNLLDGTPATYTKVLPGISANAEENGPRPVRRPTNTGMPAPKTGRPYTKGPRLNYFWNAAMQSNLCRS